MYRYITLIPITLVILYYLINRGIFYKRYKPELKEYHLIELYNQANLLSVEKPFYERGLFAFQQKISGTIFMVIGLLLLASVGFYGGK